MKLLSRSKNPAGDAGAVALAKALPPTLDTLDIGKTGCGDDGLMGLAAALPAHPALTQLWCDGNSAATARGWVALAGALPSLPALRELYLRNSPGLGSEGAAALAEAVPNCSRLTHLDVEHCGLNEQVLRPLEALKRPHDHPSGELSIAVGLQ